MFHEGEATTPLYNYHVWANRQLFQHLRTLPESLFHKEVQSVFPTLATVVVHVYFTEVIWLRVMSGEPFDQIEEYVRREEMTPIFAKKTCDEMEALYNQLITNYFHFFEQHPDLSEEVTINHPKFGPIQLPLEELIQHLINHASYHRGNITAMLRQLGYKGISTDYFVYLIHHQKS